MVFWKFGPCEGNSARHFEHEFTYVFWVCLTYFLGSDLGRTDFSRIFIFGPPDFFLDFVAGYFLLIFVRKSAQKNPPGKSPAKSSKICTTKIPDTFLQRGWAIFSLVSRRAGPSLTYLDLGRPRTRHPTGGGGTTSGGSWSVPRRLGESEILVAHSTAIGHTFAAIGPL